jgi:tryptophan 7-halogenase
MPLDRIVIGGGGVAGWMTASALLRAVPGISVTLVDEGCIDDSLGIPSHAEAALPGATQFFAQLGYDEDALIGAAHGTFSLGQAQSGWAASSAPKFMPYGDVGAPMGSVGFHHLAARLRTEGQAINPANYSVAALCAQTGRFARPSGDPRSVLSTYDYGLHFETAALAQAMNADADGVTVIDASIAGVDRDSDGLITTLRTSDGRHIEGDLFIDCTGPRALLIDTRFEDWGHWLPCNRATSIFEAGDENPLPFAHLQAHSAGWQQSIPLARGICETTIYCAEYHAGADDGRVPYTFTSGMRAPWSSNCVAIGGAAGIIDPLASTSLALAQSSILRLIGLLPHHKLCHAERTEFNRLSIEQWQCTRDFAALFYKGNARIGDRFWDACRAASVPQSLEHRMALFENMGRIALHDGEMFETQAWISQFEALGMIPRRYDTLANGIRDEDIAAHLTRLRDVMIKAVATVPPHSTYLSHINRRAK